MNLENFYIGQHVFDNHGNFWGECVSYIKRYAQELLGVPNADSVLYVKGDLAKNMYLDPTEDTLKYFDKVSSPQRDDIAVYGNPNDDSYGDVAVCLGDGQVIGQLGFPLYYPVAIRPIGNPIGYLRRKGSDMYEGKTAEQWYKDWKGEHNINIIREDYLNKIAFAAGDDLDPVEADDVNRIIKRLEEFNRLKAENEQLKKDIVTLKPGKYLVT